MQHQVIVCLSNRLLGPTQVLRYDIELVSVYPGSAVHHYNGTGPDALLKRHVRDGTSWESPRPPFEVRNTRTWEVSSAVRPASEESPRPPCDVKPFEGVLRGARQLTAARMGQG